jgi:hypothetical protein
MATFADWSATASSNTTIAGINIAEGCPPGNINNVIREIAAAAKTQDTNKADGTLYVLKSASVLSTGAIMLGRGAAIHHNNAANASGKIIVQATGAAPSMADGDILLEY